MARASILACMLPLLVAAATGAAADDAKKPTDPIEDAFQACLAKPDNQTTSGMLDCTATAYKAYDKQLNAVYERVMEKLDPRSKALLHASQREWVAFREAERKAMNGPWTHDRGSLVSLEIAAADVDAVKERIRELHLYE